MVDEFTSDAPSGIASQDSQLETLLSEGDTPAAYGRAHVDEFEDPAHIGRFVVLRRVGEGGMGIVYAAYDNELERRVAVKLVRLARVGADAGTRIRREAQALARLSHPNVVQVYEVGSHEGQLFVAMEFVTGPTLALWAQQLPDAPGRWRELLTTYGDVGRGLAAAHAAGIIHRDFKPANAIVGEDGRVRVLDFGIARAADLADIADAERSGPIPPADVLTRNTEAQDDGRPLELLALDQTLARTGSGEFAPLTMTGALMGTPAYMSPEQFERRQLGPASDQFSFCVALWEALYGERPFVGPNPAALMLAVLAGERRPPPRDTAVPTWVRDVLIRGLAQDPAARWSSMDALVKALGRDPERRRRRRRRKLAITAGFALVVAGSAWFARQQQLRAAAAASERAVAMHQKQLAEQAEAAAEVERDRALRETQAAAVRARDTARILAAREFDDRPELAAALLRDVVEPEQLADWRAAAVRILQHPLSKHVFEGHTGRLADLDVSATGRWVASASFESTAWLWRSDGGEAFALEHPDGVISLGFSPTGDRLATGCRDGVVRVWSVPPARATDGRPTPTLELPGHKPDGAIWSVRFSHAGDKLVTAARDAHIAIFALDARDEQREPSEPRRVTLGHQIHWFAEFSRDDRWIVGAAHDGLAGVWSVDDPSRPPILLSGQRQRVGDAHFDPSGRLIVTAADDGRALLYRFDPTATEPLEPHAVLEHSHKIIRTSFDAGGLRLVTHGKDGTAKLWTLDDQGELDGEPRVFDEGLTVWSADFSPDGRYLALGVSGGVTSVWPLEGGPRVRLRGHMHDVFRLRFAPDSSTLYTASNDATVRAWAIDFRSAARELPGHEGLVSALDLRGKVLASGDDGGHVRLWSVVDPGTAPVAARAPSELQIPRGRTSLALDARPSLLAAGAGSSPSISLWRIAGDRVLDPDQPLRRLALPDGAGVRALSLDPTGELLAASSRDGRVYLWRLDLTHDHGQPADAPSSDPLSLGYHFYDGDALTIVQFSPDGRYLTHGGGDGLVKVWATAALREASPGALPEPIEFSDQYSYRVVNLRFSPDGARLVSVSNDNRARIWTLSTPERAPRVLPHKNLLHDAAFSPSAPLLATACGDALAYLWPLDAGDEPTPRTFDGASGEIRDVEFSPDGELLATTSIDGHLRVWPLAGGAPFDFDAHVPLNGLRFFDHGRRLAAGSNDDHVFLWYLGAELDGPALRSRLQQATSVCLSPAQRVRYVGESLELATRNHAECLADTRPGWL